MKTPSNEFEFNRYFELRWQVLRAPWHQPPGSERDEFESDAFHIMIEDDCETPIGVGRVHRKEDRLAQIRYMAIAENWRNRGIGSQILERLEQQARSWAVTRITLNARTDVVEFYRRRGYRMTGVGETLFGAIAHTTMEKILDPSRSDSD